MVDDKADSTTNTIEPSTDISLEVNQEEEEPSLTYTLEQLDTKEQLSIFHRSSHDRVPTLQAYDADRQQQLAEGSLSDSRFDARLKQVKFGAYRSQPACLLVVSISFQPSNAKRWLRFRDATIELEFDHVGPEQDRPLSVEDLVNTTNNSPSYRGPYVTKFYPEVIYGQVATAIEQYGFEFSIPLPPPISGGGPAASYSLSRPREGARLINGSMHGDPERRVVWKVSENTTTKSGVFPLYKVAVIVRHRAQCQFKLAVKLKATTLAGKGIIGKGGAPILFTPAPNAMSNNGGGGTEISIAQYAGQQLPIYTSSNMMSMPGLLGGSLSVNEKTFVPRSQMSPALPDLEEVDLEALTGMQKMLLGKPPSYSASV